MLIALAVAGGAAVGAPCRYLVDRAVQRRHRQGFPLGTLLINWLGSAVLGLLVGLVAGAGLSATAFAAAGTGWCGAFTTYSTFGYETVQLGRQGLGLRAVGYVALSIIGGVALAGLGNTLGHRLGGS